MIVEGEVYEVYGNMGIKELNEVIDSLIELRDKNINEARAEVAAKAVTMYNETNILNNKMYTKAEVCGYCDISLGALNKALSKEIEDEE